MFPTNHQYKNAIKNKYYAINKNGGISFEPVIIDSEPVFERGNRAVVFKVIEPSSDKRNGIKLFFSEDGQKEFKFQKLSEYIRNLDKRYLVDFTYVDNLLYVDVNPEEEDNYFPGLVMEWSEGKTFGRLIKELTVNNDKKSIKRLSEKFKELSLYILTSDFAHGDLKHDNIIVDENLNLKLIDYDGMFIPEFAGSVSNELGTTSFQHPKRISKDFNKDIDDFSILSIYTSLLALAKSPNLYEQYEDQQNFLFRLEDFLEPDKSDLFRFLDTDKDLAKYSYLLKKSLTNDHIYIPNLGDCLNDKFPQPFIKVSHLPEKVISGSEIELFWKTENVDEVLFINKPIDINGSTKTNIYPNSKFVFNAKNYFDEIRFEYKIDILPDVKFLEFHSKQQKIEYGKETQLVWSIENVEKVELHYPGNMEIVGNKGEKTILPTSRIQYKLIVTALDGISKKEKKITVQVFKGVELNSFSSDLTSVREGFPVKLSWDVKNADKIILEDNLGTHIDVTHGSEWKIIAIKNLKYFKLIVSDPLHNKIEERIEITVTTPFLKWPSSKVLILLLLAFPFFMYLVKNAWDTKKGGWTICPPEDSTTVFPPPPPTDDPTDKDPSYVGKIDSGGSTGPKQIIPDSNLEGKDTQKEGKVEPPSGPNYSIELNNLIKEAEAGNVAAILKAAEAFYTRYSGSKWASKSGLK